MAQQRLILKNTLAMLGVRILTPAVNFALFVYVSRVLGPAELGKYSLLLALYLMAQTFSVLGLHSHVVREVAKEPARIPRFATGLSLIGLGASGVMVLVFFYAARSLGYPHDLVRAVGVLGGAILANGIAYPGEALLVGCERMALMSGIQIAENGVRFLLSIAGIQMGFGVTYLIGVLALSRFLSAAVYAFFIRKTYGLAPVRDLDGLFWKEVWKVGPVFLGITLCSTLLLRIDFLFLSKMRGFEELGYYTSAYRLMEVGTLFSSTLLFSIFPLMCRSGQDRLNELIPRMVLYLSAFMAGVVVLIFVFAGEMIRLLYGGGYGPSILALRLLIPAALFLSLDQAFASLLLAGNRQTEDLTALGSTLAIYATLLATLIPPFGLYGAAAATALASLAQAVFSYRFMNRHVLQFNLFQIGWKVAPAALGAGTAGWALSGLPWVLAAALAAAVYALFLWRSGVIRFREFRALFP